VLVDGHGHRSVVITTFKQQAYLTLVLVCFIFVSCLSWYRFQQAGFSFRSLKQKPARLTSVAIALSFLMNKAQSSYAVYTGVLALHLSNSKASMCASVSLSLKGISSLASPVDDLPLSCPTLACLIQSPSSASTSWFCGGVYYINYS